MKKVIVGIAGAAGYTGGELARLLRLHPAVETRYLESRSRRGERVDAVHDDLVGEERVFSDMDLDAVDVLFLCGGHGFATRFLEERDVPARVRVIDLGNDFRTGGAGGFVYGLPELYREEIRQARRVANPGCFATAIELSLLPLVAAGKGDREFTLFGVTGSTGAGQQPSPETHFSYRAQNFSNYKVFTHQHLAEVSETMRRAGANAPDIAFVPSRGAHARGIIVNAVFRDDTPAVVLEELYRDYYRASPFTVVRDAPLHLKQVVNTNYCFLHVQQHEGKVLVTAVLDNLLKGAVGQAVQNMNLMLGIEETTGLLLKASYF
ncbi:MAG: N-acetyl-gamma-glutamyl-phosphate reductase [Odoribacteraceae bacterium]|jgi:N-acetyl-gamma-glutamyl-phosphate reductase|nr:N-acetyl-gamma-glutamyl-phosphate reductase [Odoribacteraceae bacterium]